jgi:hypothetical protein
MIWTANTRPINLNDKHGAIVCSVFMRGEPFEKFRRARRIEQAETQKTFCFSSSSAGSKTGAFWANVGRVPGGTFIMNTKPTVGAIIAGFVSIPTLLHAQDVKNGAENMKYSRDVYSKVHMVAIAKLGFEAPPAAEFKYDRYPATDGGAERIQSGDGEEYARKDGKTWLNSRDWGETGQPVDAQTAKRLNNWVSVIDNRLKYDAPLKFVKAEDAGDRDEFVFEEGGKTKGNGKTPQFTFGKYKSAANDKLPILDHFSGPMPLGMHEANVDIKFSYLISVKINNMTEVKPSPSAADASPAAAPPAKNDSQSGGTVTLLDGKFKIDIPSDFKREPDDPKEPKTLAKFEHDGEGGAWGDVNRGTHGLTPEQLPEYLNKRVAEYTKGFKWMPKDAHLQWLHKEIVTINGWKWADWSFVPMPKGKKDYRNNPVYTRNLTTSYKGQLLEVNFTTNLTTDPALKDEIDKIIASMQLEE